MRQLRQLANYFSQLNDLKVWRTVLPVVYPADDEVASAGIMAMGEEVTAVKLKFNAHVLPATGLHFQFCPAIRIADLRRFNDETQTPEKHAKEKDDSHFIGGLEQVAGQVHRRAEQRAVRIDAPWDKRAKRGHGEEYCQHGDRNAFHAVERRRKNGNPGLRRRERGSWSRNV